MSASAVFQQVLRGGSIILHYGLCAIFLMMGPSCRTHTPSPNLTDVSMEQAVSRLQKECDQRFRMEGMVRAKVSGLQGLWANAKMDVVVEKPNKIHLAIRSFFEQPIQVISTNGTSLSVYDASGDGGAQFFQGALQHETLQKLSPIPVSASEFVNLLLGCAPLADSHLEMAIDQSSNTYTLLGSKGEFYVEVTANLKDDALQKSVVMNMHQQPILEVAYEEYRSKGSLRYPVQWSIQSHSSHGTQSFTLKGQDLILNGPPPDPLLFEMTAPPGLPVRPLSDLHTHPRPAR